METTTIAQRLENEMYDQCEKIKELVIGYNPSYYKNMIRENGGLNAAFKLLTAEKLSEGFITLIERGHYQLTLEYLILTDNEFQTLFDGQILKNAERKLRGLI
ncbi:hypothetical protein CLV98_105231 [Dyadobacter jejuensis]|uniref:Uncharacterized protein n=1 Tax=Dyadobacter jejuensis TaxID=1082580 RepID=A0A316ALB3_9BACT|nr:hypothetical protein [Dyadobacter jejuensis]PWJ58049.1 hypothetical protein CLV98_105231 [Dyadobacter jejuensis]